MVLPASPSTSSARSSAATRRATTTRCRVDVDPRRCCRLHADDFVVDLDITADFARGRLVARSFRRIGHVELVDGPDGLRARLHGIRHRLPVSTPVPLAAALAIAAGGVATHLTIEPGDPADSSRKAH